MSRSFSWFEWQKPAEAAPRGWAEHPIHIVVNVNICVHVAIHSTRPRQQFTHRRVATITMYDSVERGAADECEPLRGRRPWRFTLTQLLVACGAVCICAIAATTAVNTHLVSTHEDYPEGAQLGLKGAPSASGCQANLEKAEIRLKKYEATLRDVEKMVESTVSQSQSQNRSQRRQIVVSRNR